MKLQMKKQNIKILYQEYPYGFFFKNLWILFTNLNFLLFLLLFGLGLGSGYSFLSAIDYFLNSSEYTPIKVGTIGLIYVAGGSAADLFFSILIFKRRDQKHSLFNYCLKGITIILVATLLIFCIFVEKMDFLEMSIVAALLGIGYQGMVPFGLEILEEIGQMDNQLISNSYAFFGCIISVAGSTLIDMKAFKFYGIYFFILFEIPAFIVIMFFYNKSINKREVSTATSIDEGKKITSTQSSPNSP
eukprot:TRINITY_DN2232_c0_g2_i2.p2 TRINITY_DN2232_c0_g2~~TRINITY_DN2232_c0_g2_i2.p2  ORF type:complete len:245 (+),score=36.46 TRINITY_DN2232_c0_g2_i2:460-1194(+)